jgi:small redox-active disulfide protein 2
MVKSRMMLASLRKEGGKMEIKILGPGCAKCRQAEKIVMEAVAETGVEAVVEKVTDLMKIAGYGVFGTPAVIVGDEVRCVGKVPKKEDVISWLKK